MAYQEDKSAGPKLRSFENDKDWNPKVDDIAVNGREILDLVSDLKQRLSMWGRAFNKVDISICNQREE